MGRAGPLCPGSSDVNLFRYGEGIIDLDAEIAHGALDLGMAEQELHSPQVARAPVDQSCLRPAQRVGPEQVRVQTDACDPLANEPRVLPGGQAASRPPRPVNRNSPGFLPAALM